MVHYHLCISIVHSYVSHVLVLLLSFFSAFFIVQCLWRMCCVTESDVATRLRRSLPCDGPSLPRERSCRPWAKIFPWLFPCTRNATKFWKGKDPVCHWMCGRGGGQDSASFPGTVFRSHQQKVPPLLVPLSRAKDADLSPYGGTQTSNGLHTLVKFIVEDF